MKKWTKESAERYIIRIDKSKAGGGRWQMNKT